MYLDRSENCKGCNSCLEFCPISSNPKIMNCRHCPDAPCKDACNYDAFYEVSPGIWGIDPDQCIGCGDCQKACPYDAIVMEDGVARKCTLCGECIKHCPFNALKISETDKEKKEKTSILGWEKLKSGMDVCIYNPSIQEARIFKKFLSIHRQTGELDLFDEFLNETGITLNKSQKDGIIRLVEHEARFSVLDPLLDREDIEEISVISGDPVRVFIRGRGWINTNISITSEEKIIDIINKMASGIGRRITYQSPRLNANLKNSRIHAIIPPLSDRVSLTIRRFKTRPFSPRELIENKTISPEALAYLWISMQTDSNLAISGSTGSGKTTTLNTILSFIPINQRIVSIEETPELRIYHPHSIRLVSNPAKSIGMAELVEDTFRMRPDKVIVGEVRTREEIKAWINTMLSGQGKGSLSTFHALSGQEAIHRLKSLGVQTYELSALDIILVQRRWTDYKTGGEIRRVTEINEVVWGDGDKDVSLNPVFTYDFDRKKMISSLNPRKSRVIKKASEVLELGPGEIKRRASFLERSSKELSEAIKQVNEYMLG